MYNVPFKSQSKKGIIFAESAFLTFGNKKRGATSRMPLLSFKNPKTIYQNTLGLFLNRGSPRSERSNIAIIFEWTKKRGGASREASLTDLINML